MALSHDGRSIRRQIEVFQDGESSRMTIAIAARGRSQSICFCSPPLTHSVRSYLRDWKLGEAGRSYIMIIDSDGGGMEKQS